MAQDAEESALRNAAQELEAAVTAILNPCDVSRQQMANQWITNFVSQSAMWSVSLYLAFPPEGSWLGKSPEVKFFVLNLLLSKLRSDWVQLDRVDAEEIFQVLLRQLSKNADDKIVTSRLYVVISAAAAVAGPESCRLLVAEFTGGNQPASILSLEMLISLAEETLHRSRTLPWEVAECMQSCYSHVLNYLQKLVTSNFNPISKAFICLERWILSGVTLSELYSDYSFLFSGLLEALGHQDEDCAVAAAATLSELISAVDLLPGRNAAVRSVISAVLVHKPFFSSCTAQQNSNKRSKALCSLVTAIGCAECWMVSKGGADEAVLLEWLVEASGGGGGLGIDGATMAADVWPRIAAIPSQKRSHVVQAQLFSAVTQELLKVAMYPLDFTEWESSDVDEDDFYRFRSGVCEDALSACFKELRSNLLGYTLDKLFQATVWQDAEICLFATLCLCQQILSIEMTTTTIEDKPSVTAFLTALFVQTSAGPSVLETVSVKWPCGKLIETAVSCIKGFAQWIARDAVPLEKAVNYTVTALTIPDARASAAEALRELCKVSAPHLAAARALSPLMGACEKAIVSSGGGGNESIALIEGLAAVAAALPLDEAKSAIACLTSSAAHTIQDLSPKQRSAESGKALSSALKVIAAVVNCGEACVPVLREIWSSLDMVAINWAADAHVAASLCELWGMLAVRNGVMVREVLPRVVCMVVEMFKQHLSASCVDCLCHLVPLSATMPDSEQCVGNAVVAVSSCVGALEKMMMTCQEEIGRSNAAECLGAMCSLGRCCLRYIAGFPPSQAFDSIFKCALGLLQRVSNVEPALNAARFLCDTIACGSDGGDGDDAWQLSQPLASHVDTVVLSYIPSVVKIALEGLAYGQQSEAMKEALADVVYSVCLRHGESVENVMVSVMASPKFPVRAGVLSDATKKQFLTAILRKPPHSRRIFRELARDFCRVCQALSPAEVLFAY